MHLLMSGLFRKDAIKTQRHRLLGDVALAQPLSFSIITFFLIGIIAAAVSFLALASYARKETVTGFLSPEGGIAKIHAPRNGTIEEVFIREGMFVEQDAPLLTIVGGTISESGVVAGREMLEAIDSQLDESDARLKLEYRRLEAEKIRLTVECDGLVAERRTIDRQIAIQRQLLTSLELNFSRINKLADDGYVSKLSLVASQENILNNQQKLAGLLQQHASMSTQISRAEQSLESLVFEHESHLSVIETERAGLMLRKAELIGRQSITVTAPVAGNVTALQAVTGSSVNNRLPLAGIIPQDATLEAHLFIPTRAAGFIEAGQEVRLQIDAYDYKRFGIHIGTVSGISSTALTPLETLPEIQVSEPYYRVTVQLHKQSITAYGRQIALQSGMQLSADIVLQKRSLFSWLIDPLISLRGRT